MGSVSGPVWVQVCPVPPGTSHAWKPLNTYEFAEPSMSYKVELSYTCTR